MTTKEKWAKRPSRMIRPEEQVENRQIITKKRPPANARRGREAIKSGEND
jgi:hypothetical protein